MGKGYRVVESTIEKRSKEVTVVIAIVVKQYPIIKDENVNRFALSATRGELLEREREKEKVRERERETEQQII